MEYERRSIEACLAFYGTCRQQVLKLCLLIRADCESGGSQGIVATLVQYQRTPDPHKLLDRVLSILGHMPDCPIARQKIEAYAFGKLMGRPPMVVESFWRRVPAEAIRDIAPMAGAELG